ncbi:MAG: hypothetical protein JWQ49_584 [Edaphobacter sp.]|nr:hypothetical protein [Edaphobacter sp.]
MQTLSRESFIPKLKELLVAISHKGSRDAFVQIHQV